mmetsp:Transcript_23126/g.47289  ORF Transcript_23126/g.47289 Transcript_23126/m.47289 type:complete len:361 (+) Transcript_23126:490-1572(+)
MLCLGGERAVQVWNARRGDEQRLDVAPEGVRGDGPRPVQVGNPLHPGRVHQHVPTRLVLAPQKDGDAGVLELEQAARVPAEAPRAHALAQAARAAVRAGQGSHDVALKHQPPRVRHQLFHQEAEAEVSNPRRPKSVELHQRNQVAALLKHRLFLALLLLLVVVNARASLSRRRRRTIYTSSRNLFIANTPPAAIAIAVVAVVVVAWNAVKKRRRWPQLNTRFFSPPATTMVTTVIVIIVINGSGSGSWCTQKFPLPQRRGHVQRGQCRERPTQRVPAKHEAAAAGCCSRLIVVVVYIVLVDHLSHLSCQQRVQLFPHGSVRTPEARVGAANLPCLFPFFFSGTVVVVAAAVVIAIATSCI